MSEDKEQETKEEQTEKENTGKSPEKKEDPVERLRGNKLLEQRIVNISCRAGESDNCSGKRALMTVDIRDKSTVHYKCEECDKGWSTPKGDSFSY